MIVSSVECRGEMWSLIKIVLEAAAAAPAVAGSTGKQRLARDKASQLHLPQPSPSRSQSRYPCRRNCDVNVDCDYDADC